MKGAAAALIALCLTSAARADALIDHVNGTTAASGGTPFAALLIDDDGKVLRTFARGEAINLRPRYHLDGAGRTLVPGGIAALPPGDSVIGMGLRLLAKRNGLSGPLPKAGPRDRDAALGAAQDASLAAGITTVVDMGTSVDDWLAFRRAGDEGRLRVRIICYAGGIGTMVAIGGGRPTPWLYGDRLRMAGVLVNGRLPARPNAIIAKNDDARMRNEMSHGAMDGFQVAVTASTPAEVARAQAAITELSGTYPGDGRWRLLAHDQDDQHPSAAQIGAQDKIGSLTPGHSADFILFDTDIPPLPDPQRGDSVSPAEVWVGGVRVFTRAPLPVTAPSAPPR